MAKRAAPDEKPYRPLLDTDLVSAALAHVVPEAHTPAAAKVVDLPRSEPPKRFEAARATPQPTIARTTEPEPRATTPVPLAEKFDQEKRILFTRSETQAIDRLVTSLAVRLNSQVKVSHLMRALVA